MVLSAHYDPSSSESNPAPLVIARLLSAIAAEKSAEAAAMAEEGVEEGRNALGGSSGSGGGEWEERRESFRSYFDAPVGGVGDGEGGGGFVKPPSAFHTTLVERTREALAASGAGAPAAASAAGPEGWYCDRKAWYTK